jgi:hypothetical protein
MHCYQHVDELAAVDDQHWQLDFPLVVGVHRFSSTRKNDFFLEKLHMYQIARQSRILGGIKKKIAISLFFYPLAKSWKMANSCAHSSCMHDFSRRWPTSGEIVYTRYRSCMSRHA